MDDSSAYLIITALVILCAMLAIAVFAYMLGREAKVNDILNERLNIETGRYEIADTEDLSGCGQRDNEKH